MATLVEVLIHFVGIASPDGVTFSGAKDNKDKADSKLSRRTGVYLAFLEKNLSKNFPGSKSSIKGNKVTIKF